MNIIRTEAIEGTSHGCQDYSHRPPCQEPRMAERLGGGQDSKISLVRYDLRLVRLTDGRLEWRD